jgi:uncharacterized protein YifN (PemK superfamily)
MPHAFTVYKALQATPFSERQSIAIASIIEHARSAVSDGRFIPNKVISALTVSGFTTDVARVISTALKTCFWREQHTCFFPRADLKFSLVRAGMAAHTAESFLDALDPCVLARKNKEPRLAIHKHPGASTVLMCDFRYLRVPEMLKERRVIILCSPQEPDAGRCVVVPVSKTPPRAHNVHHVEFAAGAYPFFHTTESVFAVCDHAYTVGYSRVWRVNIGRKPELPQLTPPDFERVQTAVRGALRF